MGGGRGSFLAGILAQNPKVQGILFDQPQTIEHAAKALRNSAVEARCRLVGGSFLEAVPTGGDLYVLKHVLRDWDDAHVKTILSNVHNAMGNDARLIVIDAVIDPRNSKDRIAKLLDLEQMFWLDGTLRTRDEWITLLGSAGFRLLNESRTEIVDAVILESVKS